MNKKLYDLKCMEIELSAAERYAEIKQQKKAEIPFDGIRYFMTEFQKEKYKNFQTRFKFEIRLFDDKSLKLYERTDACVSKVVFDVSPWACIRLKEIRFKSLKNPKEAIEAVESYMSQPATKTYYDKYNKGFLKNFSEALIRGNMLYSSSIQKIELKDGILLLNL